MSGQHSNIELTEERIEEYGKVFLLRKEYLSAVCIFRFKLVAFGKTEQNYKLLASAYEAAGDKLKALQTCQEALLIFINNQVFTGKIYQLKSELN